MDVRADARTVVSYRSVGVTRTVSGGVVYPHNELSIHATRDNSSRALLSAYNMGAAPGTAYSGGAVDPWNIQVRKRESYH